MKKTIILLVAVVFVASFALACCNPERMVEKAIEKGLESEGGGDVDIDVGGGAKIPNDMPKELIYPGSKTMGSFSMKTDEGKMTTVSLETSSSITRVTKYYEGLSSKGWTSEMTMSGMGDEGEGAVLTISKGDLGAIVTIGSEEGKTAIVIAYGVNINK